MEMILGEENVMQTKIKAMKDKGSMYSDKQFVLSDECADKGDHTTKRHLVNEQKRISVRQNFLQLSLCNDTHSTLYLYI